ncbi:hypothetical protein MKW92_053234 [Papaver armeniacum]|nr:hypothetical protein MKW92_053234 [Papaver armeniacum]
MNRLIRASQIGCLRYSSISSKTAVSRLQRPLCFDIHKPILSSFFQTRTCISETPKSPVTTLGSFTVEDRPGEQWIRLRRNYGEEDIQIESTMFDGICPAPKISDDDTDDDADRNIISKGENDSVLQFVCFAWPDCLEIQNVFVLRHDGTVVNATQDKILSPEFASGIPGCKGVSEELAVSLHEYMKNKDKIERIQWMGNVRSFIEKINLLFVVNALIPSYFYSF